MASTIVTPADQPSPPTWVIPTLSMIYGIMAFFTAFVVAANISLFRDPALRKLPPRCQDRASVKCTLKALLIVFLSLLWPLLFVTVLFTLAAAWLVTQFEESHEHRPARGLRVQLVPDLERGASNGDSSEHRRGGMDEDRQGGGPPILSLAYHASQAQVTSPAFPSRAYVPSPDEEDGTEPPPAYTPYPTVIATLQTQWLQTPDRIAERYIRRLDDTITPDQMVQSATRVTIIPRRR